MMPKWAADFALATEISRLVINLVLKRFLTALKNQLTISRNLGSIASFTVEVTDLSITDMEDPGAPGGGVVTDLLAEANFKLSLFGITLINTSMALKIDDVEIDLSKTPAGLPKGIVLRVTPTLAVNLSFSGAGFIFGWLLNSIIGPLISLGVWLAFRIIRKVEIPVWDLVDIFAALGIRFATGSPLLTAQKALPPNSLLLASDFNLTNPIQGQAANLGHFIPQNTSVGAVVNERVIAAAVEIAHIKGWVPTRFKVGKWKIYINSIKVEFVQDKVVASGILKAKRGKCWCKVKVKITFSAAIEPRVVDVNTPNPKIDFHYDAQINTQISTSGMLVVLGVIMFAPVFMALTISMSFLINIVLNQFLPFSTSWSTSGANMTIQANSIHFSGFVPFSMNFPLQLSGHGSYDLGRFRQFTLPGGVQIQVDYTTESISLQEDELRVAIDLK